MDNALILTAWDKNVFSKACKGHTHVNCLAACEVKLESVTLKLSVALAWIGQSAVTVSSCIANNIVWWNVGKKEYKTVVHLSWKTKTLETSCESYWVLISGWSDCLEIGTGINSLRLVYYTKLQTVEGISVVLIRNEVQGSTCIGIRCCTTKSDITLSCWGSLVSSCICKTWWRSCKSDWVNSCSILTNKATPQIWRRSHSNNAVSGIHVVKPCVSCNLWHTVNWGIRASSRTVIPFNTYLSKVFITRYSKATHAFISNSWLVISSSWIKIIRGKCWVVLAQACLTIDCKCTIETPKQSCWGSEVNKIVCRWIVNCR